MTGAGSGLGRDIALGLAARNYRVFGTAVVPQEIAELHEASGWVVTLTRCDITDEVAVKEWARQVATATDADLIFSSATPAS